jgi:hypothetical protein
MLIFAGVCSLLRLVDGQSQEVCPAKTSVYNGLSHLQVLLLRKPPFAKDFPTKSSI